MASIDVITVKLYYIGHYRIYFNTKLTAEHFRLPLRRNGSLIRVNFRFIKKVASEIEKKDITSNRLSIEMTYHLIFLC